MATLTKPPALPGFVDEKDNMDNCILWLERYATIAGWQRRLFGFANYLPVKHWMFILDYQEKDARDYDKLWKVRL